MGSTKLRTVREFGQAAQNDVRGRNAVFRGVTYFHKRKLLLPGGGRRGTYTYYSLEMETAGRFQSGVICQKTEMFSPRCENPTSQKMLIVEISFHIPYASQGGVVLVKGATLDLSPIPHPTVRRGWRSLNSTDVGTSWRYRPHGGPGALYACPITSERTDGFYMKYCINVMLLGTTLTVAQLLKTFPRSLENPKVHYRTNNSPPLVTNLCRIDRNEISDPSLYQTSMYA